MNVSFNDARAGARRAFDSLSEPEARLWGFTAVCVLWVRERRRGEHAAVQAV